MAKAYDSGKAFIDQVLAKLPEEHRAKAAEAFAAPEAADAITLIGDGTLARSDYSKSKDTLDALQAQVQSDYDRLTQWYTDNKAQLDRVSTLEAELAAARKPGEVLPAKKEEVPVGLSEADVAKLLQDRDQQALAYANFTNRLAIDHYAKFGEVLDLDTLAQTAMTKKQSIADAYRETFADKLKAKADEAEAARIQKLVDERLAEERKKQSDNPFPLRNGEASVLDILQSQTDKPSNHNLDSAVAEYDRLQSARG